MNKQQIIKLKEEKNEIYSRLKKLDRFISSTECKQLSIAEKNMLRAQHEAMFVYGLILRDRIAYYEGKPTCNNWEV